MGHSNPVGKAISGAGKWAGGITQSVGNLAKIDPKDVYRNPGNILGAVGDVGQTTLSPAAGLARAAPGGGTVSDWTVQHQGELGTAAAIALTAGGAAPGAAGGAALGSGVLAGQSINAVDKTMIRDPKKAAEMAAADAANLGPVAVDVDPEALAQLRRQRMLAAYGRNSTILTDPSGGSSSLGTASGKTSLGL